MNGNRAGITSHGDPGAETVVSQRIIAGNAGTDVNWAGPACNSFMSFGGNLIGSGNALANFNKPGDSTGHTAASIKLAPLGNYSGPTTKLAE